MEILWPKALFATILMFCRVFLRFAWSEKGKLALTTDNILFGDLSPTKWPYQLVRRGLWLPSPIYESIVHHASGTNLRHFCLGDFELKYYFVWSKFYKIPNFFFPPRRILRQTGQELIRKIIEVFLIRRSPVLWEHCSEGELAIWFDCFGILFGIDF